MKARKRENRFPSWGVLEVCEASDEKALEPIWAEAEIRWIAYFRNIGADLLNHAVGGPGRRGSVWTEGQKKAQSDLLKKRETWTGRKHSEETRQKISETQRLRAKTRREATQILRIESEVSQKTIPIDIPSLLAVNESAIERRRTEEELKAPIPWSQRKHRPESRHKQSIAKISAWANRAWGEEMEVYAAWDGYTAPPKPPKERYRHSEGTKELLRQARAKQIIPPEAYERMAEKRRGTHHSPETRAKLSKTAKARVERDGPPASKQSPESRVRQSEKMRENWKNGVFERRRELTPEEMERANEKRREAMGGKFYGDREKALEGIRRDGLIRAYRNDLAEIETLQPEALFPEAVKYWYAEASQTRRFLSREDFARFHDAKCAPEPVPA